MLVDQVVTAEEVVAADINLMNVLKRHIGKPKQVQAMVLYFLQ
jgi:hypothetical protein